MSLFFVFLCSCFFFFFCCFFISDGVPFSVLISGNLTFIQCLKRAVCDFIMEFPRHLRVKGTKQSCYIFLLFFQRNNFFWLLVYFSALKTPLTKAYTLKGKNLLPFSNGDTSVLTVISLECQFLLIVYFIMQDSYNQILRSHTYTHSTTIYSRLSMARTSWIVRATEC